MFEHLHIYVIQYNYSSNLLGFEGIKHGVCGI